jgi:type IV pilus assembly protein PilY1
MKTIGAIRTKTQFLLLLSLLLLPAPSRAASMKNYCVVPAFIQATVPANLLLMIDNSSSMFDLSYSDQGQTGTCSVTTSRTCQSSADCPIVSGTTHETCTNGRVPTYCFDETYRSNVCSGDSTVTCGADTDCATGQTCRNLYAGYFSSTTYYSYDLTNKYFVPATYDSTKCTKGRANTLCVGISGSNTVNYFGASGNYLNWLTSSKFDVEKGILTGGKDVVSLCSGTDRACTSTGDCAGFPGSTCTAVATSFLQSESRGCLGQGFAKIALTSDFTNYRSTSTDPNTQLGLAFLIKGPKDSTNPSAPSRGGQTYIEVYNGAGNTPVNTQACSDAINAWASDDKQGMSTYSQTCIGYNSSVSSPNYCYANPSLLCPNNTTQECIVTTTAQTGKCNKPAGQICSSDSDCGTTVVYGTCSAPAGRSCLTNGDCPTAEVLGTCSPNISTTCRSNGDCGTTSTPGLCGLGNSKAGQTCYTNNDCMSGGTLGTCSNSSSHKCSQNGDCTIATVDGTCSAGTNAGGACTSSANCPTNAVSGTCSAGTNAGGACTSSANCPTAAVNGTCSAGTNARGACTSSANCPTAAVNGTCSNVSRSCAQASDCNVTEKLGTCKVGGTSCKANSDCASYCSNNTNKGCSPVGSSCSGNNGTCVSDTCTGYVAPSTGSCQNYIPAGTASCTGYVPAGTAACNGYVPAGTASCNGYVAGSTGSCNGYTAGSTGSCVGATTTQNSCSGYQAAGYGTCNGASTTQNTCSNPAPVQASTIDYGPCVNPTQSLVVKTKVAYTHTINTCAQYLGTNGTLGSGDVTNFENGGDCQNIYGAGVCSNAPTQGCAKNSDCTAPGTCVAGPGVCLADNNRACASNSDCSNNVCTKGPAAILTGNAALICSMDYLGAYYTGSAPTWQKNAWSSDMTGQIQAFKNYCAAVQPTEIDPTSAVSASTSNYEQTPALLAGMAVEGQYGSPIGTLPVRLKINPQACTTNTDCTGSTVCSNGACVPSGLIQQFGSKIRIGAMSFNFNGSATEAGAAGTGIALPQVCSNDTTRLCAMNVDCISPGICQTATNNYDGAQVIYPVGLGNCATMTTTVCSGSNPCSSGTCINGLCGTSHSTVCATDISCASGDTCMSSGVGDHTTGLINTLDRIRANAWTPLAEAFYNAIGYFAVQKVCDNSGSTSCKTDGDCGVGGHCNVSTGKSRTDLRINSINTTSTDFTSTATAPMDFNENLNPSQYSCQRNFVLLVTDGSSTADRHPFAANLASANSSQSGSTAGQCNYFAGSTYLPTLSWLGNHMNLTAIPAPTASTPMPPAATAEAAQGRDYITTYVVNTGVSNGLTGACYSANLLGATASNGGTSLYTATDPASLKNKLQSVFQSIAAQTSSGTAASILSNSEGTGANILQALFYPKKDFVDPTSATWIGELHNLWYFVDPFLGNSTVREDTDSDNVLDLKDDYALTFNPPDSTNGYQTTVTRKKDPTGSGDVSQLVNVDTVSPDDIKSLWRAGRLLLQRDLSSNPRTIYTPCLSSSGASCTTSTSNLMSFNTANATYLQPLLQTAAAPSTETSDIISWVRGDESNTVPTGPYRSRTVTVSTGGSTTIHGPWLLGDIISSTPRLMSTTRLNSYDLPPPAGYSDPSYAAFIGTSSYTSSSPFTTPYTNRGMVFVGANDGMLHAFNLGVLNVTASGTQKATLSGTNLGQEQWAFIPQNALPYLRYLTCVNGTSDSYCNGNDYSHLYYVDGTTTIIDASLATPTGGCSGSYWDCTKDKTNGSNWKTVLIGGMGIGGASRSATDTCAEDFTGTCVKTPIMNPADTTKGLGYSSYYALDVTDPNYPKLMWEFSDGAIPTNESANRGLGFATSGVATVKINATTSGAGDPSKNGRWFAVFGSGPTGPIDQSAHQFMATSNQRLRVYVVDLNAQPPFSLGTNYWVIDQVYDNVTSGSASTLDNAFISAMSNATIDVDHWNKNNVNGFYSDDALYFGYTQANTTSSGTSWTKGGVLRLVTSADPNPDNWKNPNTWKLTKVFESDGSSTVGAVTSTIGRLQDRKNHNLWLYFGTGRYFYKNDDPASVQRLYAIKEPCYTTNDTLDVATCNSKSTTKLTPSNLDERTTVTAAMLSNPTVTNGWFITLEGQNVPTNGYGAERVVTDPVALTNGQVFFTTFKPSSDPCSFGGNSYMWAVAFNTGLAVGSALQGKALLQVSTGSFQQVDLSTQFTDKGGRRTGVTIMGKPPSDPPPVLSKSNLKPVKRILHIQEH